MKILSLFDGISCGREALKKAKIPVEVYYASEIDEYAMKISNKNWPDIIQIGDVSDIYVEKGFLCNDAFEDEQIGYVKGKIDLLIGGSPCQDLSIAGRREGLKGKKSGLFYEYVRILKEVKPKYFILENVNSMSNDAKDTITKELFNIEPVMINASLVSAQNRKRLFWVGKLNDRGRYEKIEVPQPKDKKILLKDIIHETRGEKFDLEKYIVKGNHLTWITDDTRLQKKRTALNGEKSITMMARQYASWNGQYLSVRVGKFNKGGQGDRIYSIDGKSVALSALGGGRGAKTGLYLVEGAALRNRGEGKKPEFNKQEKSNAMTSVQTDSLVLILQEPHGYNKGGIKALDGKTPTLSTSKWEHNNNLITGGYIRKLTPIECCRLQCIPDNTTHGVSDSQAYKVTGNAFNADVVAHILSFMPY